MEIKVNFKRTSHKVGLNFWHFEWCTKYRYNMMNKYGLKNLVKASLIRASKENNIKIHMLEVMPDHIHMLVSLPNNMTDSEAIRLLKGRSAYIIFRNRPHVRYRYPRGHFWSAGSFSATVGYNDLDSMTKYIKNQKEHHGLA